MDDIIAEFLAETRDSLGDLDNDLLELEKNSFLKRMMALVGMWFLQ